MSIINRQNGFIPTPERESFLFRARNANSRLVWGFTLVETLVVVAIISILSSFILINLGAARAKARDVKRKTALSQIGQFLTFSCYKPDAGPGEYDLADLITELKVKNPQRTNLIAQIPQDPKTGTETRTNYRYILSSDSTECALYANLENESEKITLPGISTPTPGAGTGVLKATTDGWNGSPIYLQYTN